MIHFFQPTQLAMTLLVNSNKLKIGDYSVHFLSYPMIFVVKADALDASQRKTLALNVMKVYRENIPQLDNEDRLYYVRATLVNLNIKQELWSDDRSTPNVHRD